MIQDIRNSSNAKQIIFTVNGPGEVYGWLRPLAYALRLKYPDIRIVVMILPCVYSTGAEASVARGLGTVDIALPVRDVLRFILTGRHPHGLDFKARSLVFHLGGEVALTILLAARLRAPLYAYAEQALRFGSAFRKIFFNGLNRLPKLKKIEPSALVGELMVDAAALTRSAFARTSNDQQTIGLFPGSRSFMVELMLTYYAVTVDDLTKRIPNLRWVLALAPFVDDAVLRSLTPREGRNWPATPLSFHENGTERWLQTPSGNRIEILHGREVLAIADVALTIPGTNTGELAAGGTPMVVVLPTYVSNEVPLPGLAGHIGRIPLIGKAIKSYLAFRLLRSLPMLAQPNRRAGRFIVTELVGTGLHQAIAVELERLLTNDTSALRDDIRNAMGRSGAAQRLADEIDAHFSTSEG
jgi:hypothetical protein